MEILNFVFKFIYPTSVTKVTNSVYDLSYDMVGELENNTSAFLVAVFKRTSALIYDASGLLFTTNIKVQHSYTIQL